MNLKMKLIRGIPAAVAAVTAASFAISSQTGKPGNNPVGAAESAKAACGQCNFSSQSFAMKDDCCSGNKPELTSGGEQSANQQPAVDMEKFLSFKLTDAKTKQSVTLGSLKGKAKAIYLDFFASWCGPCQKVIPEVIELDKMTNDSDVLVLGINVSDEWDAMQANIAEKKVTYRVLHDPTPRGQSGIGSIAGVNAIPTVMILDGKTLAIKQRWVGANPQFKAQQIEVLKSLGAQVN